jgi:prophage regulatory protein
MILRLQDVIKLTGLSDKTLRRMELAGSFPRRRKIAARAIGFSELEIKKWLKKFGDKQSDTGKKPTGGRHSGKSGCRHG